MTTNITRDVERYALSVLLAALTSCFGLGVIAGLLAGIWLWGG